MGSRLCLYRMTVGGGELGEVPRSCAGWTVLINQDNFAAAAGTWQGITTTPELCHLIVLIGSRLPVRRVTILFAEATQPLVSVGVNNVVWTCAMQIRRVRR